MRVLAGCALLALSSCYHAQPFAACELSCTDTCPDDLQCVAGLCRDDSCMPARPDAGVGPVDDAPLMSCDGTLVGSLVQYCFAGSNAAFKRSLPSSITGPLDCDAMVTNSSGQPTCLIVGIQISMTTSMSLTTGMLVPVAVIARDSIAITSDIELGGSSELAAAGGDYHGCPVATSLAGATGDLGGGGAAGGSFGGTGGGGGDGEVDSMGHATPGGMAQPADPTFVASPSLRGGCSGGTNAGPGAHSGGAIYLAAGSDITIAATIDASGAGGPGGASAAAGNVSGGAGGASGGLIVLEAPTITGTVPNMLAANGGAGASGDSESAAGNAGGNGSATAVAMGGRSDLGGDGGNGSFDSESNGDDGGATVISAQPGGGGGGGGGAGVILVLGAATGLQSSPPFFVP